MCSFCDDGYHVSCTTPPLEQRPMSPNWCCSHCTKGPLAATTTSTNINNNNNSRSSTSSPSSSVAGEGTTPTSNSSASNRKGRGRSRKSLQEVNARSRKYSTSSSSSCSRSASRWRKKSESDHLKEPASDSDDSEGMHGQIGPPKKLISDKLSKEKAKFFKRSFGEKGKVRAVTKSDLQVEPHSTAGAGVSRPASTGSRVRQAELAAEFTSSGPDSTSDTSSSDESGTGLPEAARMRSGGEPSSLLSCSPAGSVSAAGTGIPARKSESLSEGEVDSGSGTPQEERSSSSTNSSSAMMSSGPIRSLFDGLSHLYTPYDSRKRPLQVQPKYKGPKKFMQPSREGESTTPGEVRVGDGSPVEEGGEGIQQGMECGGLSAGDVESGGTWSTWAAQRWPASSVGVIPGSASVTPSTRAVGGPLVAGPVGGCLGQVQAADGRKWCKMRAEGCCSHTGGQVVERRPSSMDKVPRPALSPGVTERDLDMFKKAQETATQEMDKNRTTVQERDPFNMSRCPASIDFGQYDVQTWYSAPYPQEYAR
ncbi:Histone acetyltransferase KAT6B [Chionoecetes opilio]|uniref:Histone acetyltransferase KAT6B n=1 Tax=Chionoecetes opilio TaxID=41210 RepID=A0A8J4XZH8_CHIOP|nr:Histone acetyltransferase KAT6B [Chionoecetes opilio]